MTIFALFPTAVFIYVAVFAEAESFGEDYKGSFREKLTTASLAAFCAFGAQMLVYGMLFSDIMERHL